MKLATLAILAAAMATPALAADDYDNAPNTATAAAPDSSQAADPAVAAQDHARQELYKHKLDAAKAQTQADDAQAQADNAQSRAADAAAQRDTALDKAHQDREDLHANQ
jgi:hypothetical protein